MIYAQESIKIDEFEFPIEPTISISFQKNIIETYIPGDKGSVKELIEEKEAEITISGVLKLENIDPKVGSFGTDVKHLHTLFKQNKTVKLVSKLASDLGIQHVVIKSLDLPATKSSNLQPFSLKLVEDKSVLEFE